jgi:hypothetical protein
LFKESCATLLNAVLRIRMFISDPGSEFFFPGSRIQGQKDSGSWMPGP